MREWITKTGERHQEENISDLWVGSLYVSQLIYTRDVYVLSLVSLNPMDDVPFDTTRKSSTLQKADMRGREKSCSAGCR